MNKLIFYNNNNSGDIHFSREFIKDIMRKTSFDEYHHLNKRSPKLTMDIPDLQYAPLNEYCKPNSTFYTINNGTYINTHLGGAYDLTERKLYDVDINVFYDYFYNIFCKLKIRMENKKFYIPEIDYNYFKTDTLNKYLESNKTVNKVLVCNGDVYSNQSFAVDFIKLVSSLATDYPQMHFILTNKSEFIDLPNIFYTDDIINSTGSDLNEISYLSTHCSVIIGRASGPYSFTEVKKNMNDMDKIFIFLCNIFSDGIWCEQTSCSKVWINNDNYENIYDTIKTQLKNINNIKNLFQIVSKDDRIYITPLETIPFEIRIECYNEISLVYRYTSLFSFGAQHWILPYAHYTTGVPIKCKFFNNENGDYLFESLI